MEIPLLNLVYGTNHWSGDEYAERVPILKSGNMEDHEYLKKFTIRATLAGGTELLINGDSWITNHIYTRRPRLSFRTRAESKSFSGFCLFIKYDKGY